MWQAKIGKVGIGLIQFGGEKALQIAHRLVRDEEFRASLAGVKNRLVAAIRNNDPDQPRAGNEPAPNP